jgi:hypothetical protein
MLLKAVVAVWSNGGSGLGALHGGGRRGATGDMGVAPFGAEQGREREADQWDRAAQCQSVRVKWYSSRFKSIPFNLNQFKQTSNYSKFNWSKKDHPKLENFEIKYGVEAFDKRNNFLYINFFRFEVYFELKIREAFEV